MTLGSASSNAFTTFAEAGVADAATVTYCIEDGTDFEIGTGVYTSSGTTLTRATVLISKIAGTSGTTKINLSGGATVRVIYAKEDVGTFNEDILLQGIISPAQITADQNNYNPSGLATANVLRINSDAVRSITGLTAGVSGQTIFVINTGSSFSIFLVEESASSTAANRFVSNWGTGVELVPKGAAILFYDTTLSRWTVLAGGNRAAGQLEQEGGSTAAVFTAPFYQQFHPSAAKVWVCGTPNSTTIKASYNVTSLGDTATGQQTVTIATDFSSANYCVLVTVGDTSTTLGLSDTVMTKAAGSYIMNAVVEAGSGLDPTSDWNSVGFGDQ